MQDTATELAAIVDKILRSYAEHGHINHLDGSNLPARTEVRRLVDDLMSLMFPGYFEPAYLDDLTARFFVGERCVRCLRTLEPMIARAMTAECARTAVRATPAEITERAHDHAMALIQGIPGIRSLLDTDVHAALAGDPAAKSAPEVITSYPGIAAIAVHRIAHELYRRNVPMLPRMMSELIHGRTGIDIHPGAQIGASFFIDHGTGVVIGETCQIGDRVKLYQGVTLGALSIKPDCSYDARCKRHPTLEDDVTVYAGATILGGDTVIGRGSVVGGNVWLTRSLPPQTTIIVHTPAQRIVARARDDDT